jgi:hypothetical protein
MVGSAQSRRSAASLILSKSEVDLSKREVSGVRACRSFQREVFHSCATDRVNLVSIRHGHRAKHTPWEDLDELENSKDYGSAGGHGNQHVRLRGA